MDQHSYQKRFSRMIRWRLSKPEADEVLSDYEGILAHCGEKEYDELVDRFGEPNQAAKQLTDPRSYRRWLIAFTCMAFCLLIPLWLLLKGQFWRQPTVLMVVLLILGMVFSLVQFRPRSEKNPMPRGLRPALVGLVVLLVVVSLVLACLITGVWSNLPAGWYGQIARLVLCLTGIAGVAGAFLGIVKARLCNRRWSALYLLGLTSVVECTMILAFLACLDTAFGVVWTPYILQFALVGAVGLVGTVVALC